MPGFFTASDGNNVKSRKSWWFILVAAVFRFAGDWQILRGFVRLMIGVQKPVNDGDPRHGMVIHFHNFIGTCHSRGWRVTCLQAHYTWSKNLQLSNLY